MYSTADDWQKSFFSLAFCECARAHACVFVEGKVFNAFEIHFEGSRGEGGRLEQLLLLRCAAVIGDVVLLF